MVFFVIDAIRKASDSEERQENCHRRCQNRMTLGFIRGARLVAAPPGAAPVSPTPLPRVCVAAGENQNMCWAYAAAYVCRCHSRLLAQNAATREDVDARVLRQLTLEWSADVWTARGMRRMLHLLGLQAHADLPDDPTLFLFRTVGAPGPSPRAPLLWTYTEPLDRAAMSDRIVALVAPVCLGASQRWQQQSLDVGHWVAGVRCPRTGSLIRFDSIGGGARVEPIAFRRFLRTQPGMAYALVVP